MNQNVAQLIADAKTISLGMIRVAAAKRDEHPLQSDAQTFRGAAHLLNALTLEVARHDALGASLTGKLQRIAQLKVRGAAEAIEDGNWKAIVEELQALAQEALTPGSMTTRRQPKSGRVDDDRKPR